jgi:MSHA pilin protein MshD
MFMSKSLQKGFTLIELIIFIVVLGVGLAGVLVVMNTVVKSSVDPMVRKQTMAIAESLMEEILLKNYAKPTDSTALSFSAGGNRALFDCVDDYNHYATTGINDTLGSPVAGLERYNVTPQVSVVASNDLTGVSAKKITVSVTSPSGTISLSGYRANY